MVYGNLGIFKSLNINLLFSFIVIKKQSPGSSVSVDVARRARKSKFFYQINTVIDWPTFPPHRTFLAACGLPVPRNPSASEPKSPEIVAKFFVVNRFSFILGMFP